MSRLGVAVHWSAPIVIAAGSGFDCLLCSPLFSHYRRHSLSLLMPSDRDPSFCSGPWPPERDGKGLDETDKAVAARRLE